ncbi:nitroreductase family protein [Aeromonas simiae]|uniref:nitroreductase family protein n=1 Tax=Aeromonas simiae TaxID=218936 RepID=UPI0005A608A3|nr:nitroreductase family protein [Aeromonas simiae]MDO2948390.1 nitroreductase family protein [Aeromonas simiae]MDO2951943.1 nitroreductase family protein [Aeromonas simiae]MDO2955773.1 nitroreductase family protein [Aeromonas simiae]
MSNAFIDQITHRRTIYALGDKVSHTPEQLTALIQEAVRQSPSAFNSQSSRVVILFGEHHHQLWDIVKAELKKLVPAEAYAQSENKVNGCFRAGFATVLFFEDQDVVKDLQAKFASYADNFPIWSEHSTGIAQFAVWTALAQEQLGASLQHYNPIIDEAVRQAWNLPESWRLRAQMPFGSIEQPAGEKPFMDDAARFRVFK